MLKVLIVDDDSISRTNIKTLINWDKYGFEISGEAANGANAIQIINDVKPEIVITDMSMPVMDGVALIEHLDRNFPEIKVIALSGYDDFEYVRQSMKRGALDYLLKHKLNSEVLISVLETAKQMIVKELQSSEQESLLKEQLTESRAVLRQTFVRQLVQGAIVDRDEIGHKIKSLELELDTRNLAVIAAEMDDFHFLQEKYSVHDITKLISSFTDIAREILKESGKAVVSHIEGGKFALILSFGNMRSDLFIYNYIITTVDRIKSSIKRYLNITACFSLSGIYYDIAETSKYYKIADTALQDKFYTGKDRIIKESAHESKGAEFFNLEINDEKNIINAIKAADKEKLNEYVDRIFNRIVAARASYKSIQMICAELINIINRIARESGFDAKLVYSDEEIPYDEMKKFETAAEVKQWLVGVYEKLIALIEVSGVDPGYSEPTKKAIEFIQRNYSKNVSLNDAADYIGVNSSYLSRVFKKDCGKGFVEYLNMIRLQHAKHLIQKGNIKLKEVVKEVGFNNYTYFFKVFKDNENMTPLEYEEIYNK